MILQWGFACLTLHLFSLVCRCQKDRADDGGAWGLNLKVFNVLSVFRPGILGQNSPIAGQLR